MSCWVEISADLRNQMHSSKPFDVLFRFLNTVALNCRAHFAGGAGAAIPLQLSRHSLYAKSASPNTAVSGQAAGTFMTMRTATVAVIHACACSASDRRLQEV